MDARAGAKESGVRVVFYCVEPLAYQLLSTWTANEGHRAALVVTTPGPTRARNTLYRDIVAQAPPGQDVLVTTGMRRIAPIIRALAPDLIVSFTFPYRIPPEITAIPRFGAVNLHPSPLPRYRGPNPVRMVYEGEPILGATLHRTAEGFDTGAILSRREHPLPDDPTVDNILAVLGDLLMTVLTEGARRALAGGPGMPQDESTASYAASFTEDEMWLNWNEPSRIIQRRASALNLLRVRARAMIDGQAYAVSDVTPLPNPGGRGKPGWVIDRQERFYTIRTADGAVRVSTTTP